jgi:hypothetical protein
MKKLLIISIALLPAVAAFAKKKAPVFSPSFSLRAGLGYAFPIAGSEALVYGANLQPVSGTQSYDGTYNTYNLKKASMSSGFGAVIAPCFMFNEHIGVEVAAAIGISMKKYKLAYTSTEPNASFTDNITTYAKLPVVIMPAIVVSTGNSNKLSGYARAGLALPVSSRIVSDEQYADATNGALTSTFEVKNHFSVGLSGAAGARYKMNRSLNLWVELNGMAMSLQPKTGQYTSIIQGGQQVVAAFNVADTHYQYESSFSERENNSSAQPTKAASIATPFSNLGISLGVSFGL